MCGIAGILVKDRHQADVSTTMLHSMRDSLVTRGPDGAGIYVTKGVGFVHTRLSVIDIEQGAQPLEDSSGCVVIFNGEIYNYLELRERLAAQYEFRTHSDTEVILALYHCYGQDFVQHLRGMYAIALYDPTHERMILTRDPFGIKPLYVSESATEFAFSSEIKALTRSGCASSDIDYGRVRQILTGNFVHGVDTVYPNVGRLAPGEMRIYEQRRCIANNRHSYINSSIYSELTEPSALTNIDRILNDSVMMHSRSDVGFGLFLSGGVDSSVLMHLLARQHKGADPIKTYTAFFDVSGSSTNEMQMARHISSACGGAMREVLFGVDDFRTLLPQIAAYMDDPVTDYAVLPTWKLASVAATEQKVVLCGEGADELFAGYGRYKDYWWRRKRRTPNVEGALQSWSNLQRKQAHDIQGYLPNDLLVKLDTCLMAHGLEGRTPFLDRDVARFAFSLPDRLKIRGRHGKYILKKWLESVLPDAKPFHRKRGFTVPVGEWIAQDGAALSDVLTQNHFLKELLTTDELHDLPSMLRHEKGAKECWRPLYLALWHTGRKNSLDFKGLPPILDALAD